MIDLDLTFIIQIGIFLVLLFILNKLLFKPYLKLFEERDGLVDGMREGASAIKKQVAEKSAQFDEAVREATLGAAQRVERMRAEGQAVAADMLAKSREKSAAEIEKAVTQIRAEAEVARKDLVRDVNLISVQIAEKVLGRKMA